MTWLFLLGGMLVWATHFSGVYAISSFGAVFGDAGSQEARIGVAVLTVAAAVANMALLFVAAAREPHLRGERDEMRRFLNGVAALGAFVSLAAVLWQGLPVLVIGR
jgi:hypothetical protein